MIGWEGLSPFILVFVLIAISAFFSGAETGLFSVTRAKIHKLKMQGNHKAIVLSKLREDKERLISTILFGNNVVNIAASAIATSLAIQYFGKHGVVLSTVMMTMIVLVFAEVLPKTYAVRHAEQVALFVAPIFVLINKIFSPFAMSIHLVVNRIINGFSNAPREDMTGTEVLRGTVELYHEEGGVLKEDKDMLSGILDLENIEIEEIMIHRSDMVSINIEEPVEKIVEMVVNSSHSRIPIWKDSPDHILGIIYAKDILRAIQKNPGDLASLDIKSLLHKPWFVPETTTLKNQLKAFRENQRHFALVVDEYSSITGVITLEDIIEEIVGDIEDEYDKPNRKRIIKCKNGAYNVDGDVSIRDLNKELEWNLPDEDATTIAGLVLAEAQRIPDVGDIFEIEEAMFKVLKKEGTQLTRIQVRVDKNIHETVSEDDDSVSDDEDLQS